MVQVTRCSTLGGTDYDLYEPKKTALATYILIYGLDLPGEKDARLVHFCQACAGVDLRAVAPSLEGLKSFDFAEGDLEALVELVGHLHGLYNRPIGMIGFSAGGSYSLIVACNEKVADWIDPLVLFSPYYTLSDLWLMQNMQPTLNPSSDRDWDHLVWSQLVLAYRSRDTLTLNTQEREELTNLLYHYCAERSLERKLDFYHRVLQHLLIPGLEEFHFDARFMELFSPCGKLNGVKGRVIIFHDPYDYLIPPEHSQRILSELELRGTPGLQRLLVTPLISHVTPRYGLRVKEIFQTLDMLGELFAR